MGLDRRKKSNQLELISLKNGRGPSGEVFQLSLRLVAIPEGREKESIPALGKELAEIPASTCPGFVGIREAVSVQKRLAPCLSRGSMH